LFLFTPLENFVLVSRAAAFSPYFVANELSTYEIEPVVALTYGAMPPLPLLPTMALAPLAARIAAKKVPGAVFTGTKSVAEAGESLKFASVFDVKLLCMPHCFCAAVADFPGTS